MELATVLHARTVVYSRGRKSIKCMKNVVDFLLLRVVFDDPVYVNKTKVIIERMSKIE